MFKQEGIKLAGNPIEFGFIARWIRKGNGAIKPKQLLKETPEHWIAYDEVAKTKLIGLDPNSLKLRPLKAVKVIAANYGLTLEPEPKIIPFLKVHPQLRAIRAANGGKWSPVIRNGHLVQVASGRFTGIWRVFSTKTDKNKGLVLDLGEPDAIRATRRDVRLKSLQRDGMTVAKRGYTGVAACPITSSASTARSAA
jgi:hypothetical protein